MPGHEQRLLEKIGSLPVYLTIDLDILDPACLPATGNPEAGGWFYQDLERFFRVAESMTLLGADVVELNPRLDISRVGAVTAAKIVRELLLILAGHR
jgi:agmatinase